MARFDECLNFVLGVEGGYSNHSADRGGATNLGVTQEVYDDYRSGKGLCRIPVSGISAIEVNDIYRTRYWKPIMGDQLPPGVDLVVFDAAVNHGVRQASKFLQRALGVDDDGIVGKATIKAAHEDDAAGNTPKVISNIIDQRRDFYAMLVAKNASQKVFLAGWNNRLDHLSHEVA